MAGEPVCDGLTRTTLELRCTNYSTVFKKTFDERGRSTFYGEGEMVKLDSACPNKVRQAMVQRPETVSIRKFKKRY